MDGQSILDEGSNFIILISIGLVTDIFQATCQGICRGLGRQLMPSIISFINFYV